MPTPGDALAVFTHALRDAGLDNLSAPDTDIMAMPGGRGLMLTLDPLESGGPPDTNAPCGSIFAVVESADAGRVRAAGYVLYGARCLLVVSCGNGVQVHALDAAGRTFVLERARVTLPRTAPDLTIDVSQYRHWARPVRAYVDDCIAGAEGPRAHDMALRWTPSLVAEAHRILMRGGIYLAPADARPGHGRGSLRLLHQAAPIAFVFEQAGGRATDGALPLLNGAQQDRHARTPLVFGCADKVDRVAAYHDLPEAEVSALFGHRGLFRN